VRTLTCPLARFLFRAEQRGLARFVSMQNNYSLLCCEEEREMIPLCREEGIGLIPYSPIGGGLLAGRRRRNTVRSILRWPVSASTAPPTRR
jgi:1-deoxyxylulose-5-phosphate synthase